MLNTSSVLHFLEELDVESNNKKLKFLAKLLYQACNCRFQEWSQACTRLIALCLNSPLIFILEKC